MANKIISANRIVVWIQENKGEKFVPFSVENSAGMTGLSLPGTSQSQVWGTDNFGNPTLLKSNRDAPSGLASGTLSIFEKGQMDIIRRKLDSGCPINIQTRIVECGNLINPTNYTSLDLWSNGIFESATPADAPLIYDATELMTEGTLTFDSYIRVVQLSLATLTTTETENALAIDGVEDILCGDCSMGAYQGENKHLFVGTSAVALGVANVLFSSDGGGTWTEILAKPFSADEDIDFISVGIVGSDRFRVVVGTSTTDAAVVAKFAYGDTVIGDEVNITWTEVLISAGAVGDIIEAMGSISYDRGYISSAGDIYLSTDNFVSDPGAAIYTGTVAFNGFAGNSDESQIWAFGATNTILRESDSTGVFVARTGPTGGGDFSAVTVANDGLLYAGNGTTLYLSLDEAGIANNWRILKDFGTNNTVVKIECVKGESQLLRVVVNDSVGSGSVWQSVDGGATFNQYTSVTNSGYNDATFSNTDANRMVIVGDTDSGTALIQSLS